MSSDRHLDTLTHLGGFLDGICRKLVLVLPKAGVARPYDTSCLDEEQEDRNQQ